MMWEYYKQTGDEETIRLYRGDVDRILEYYDSKIGGDGLVGRLEYWEFVDWQPAWNDCAGIPGSLPAWTVHNHQPDVCLCTLVWRTDF